MITQENVRELQVLKEKATKAMDEFWSVASKISVFQGNGDGLLTLVSPQNERQQMAEAVKEAAYDFFNQPATNVVGNTKGES